MDEVLLDFAKLNVDNDKKVEPQLKTEDFGKIFEMAICLLYSIPFDGKFKYSITDSESLIQRLLRLKDHVVVTRHIAKRGNRYDFLLDHDDKYLSAKTNKNGAKVCPQVIGQPSQKKFKEFFKLHIDLSLDGIKEFINESLNEILEKYFEYTFDCDIIYYNKPKDILLLIKQQPPINFTECHLSKNPSSWRESSTVKYNNTSIGEFQIQNHRDCIKFRWDFLKLLSVFSIPATTL